MLEDCYKELRDERIRITRLLDKVLYRNISTIKLDVYYLKEKVVPIDITKKYGTSAANYFAIELLKQVKIRNNTDEVWRFQDCAFGIFHSDKNCGEFELEYRGFIKTIGVKTISINVE